MGQLLAIFLIALLGNKHEHLIGACWILTKIKEEVRARFPRLTMSLIMTIIFLVISLVISNTREISPLNEITIPGIEGGVITIVWIVTLVITTIFLVRALSDALVLIDILTDIFVKRLGIKEKISPKRAARDLIYIIVVILIVTAASPIVGSLEGDAGSWLTTIIIYIGLGIIIILIYDIGRIFYRIIENRAEALADSLSKIAEHEDAGE